MLTRGFFRIIRERHLPALIPWIAAAKHTALTGFASRLEGVLDAAEAALKLRGVRAMSKAGPPPQADQRQTYGRAGFDLLRLRVLQQGW